jgi:hypothetical protein
MHLDEYLFEVVEESPRILLLARQEKKKQQQRRRHERNEEEAMQPPMATMKLSGVALSFPKACLLSEKPWLLQQRLK